MTAPVDRVQLLKQESTAGGGDDADGNDAFPAQLDPTEDAIDSQGGFVQKPGGPVDEAVYWTRDASDNLILRDPNANSGTELSLSDLLGASFTSGMHRVVRQLIHFIDDGPAEGFATGTYREVTGTLFPSAVVWWESSGKAKKIVEKLITWTGVKATTVVWKVYDTDGTTVLATVTDSITYSGIFETSRTRAIA